MDINKERNMTHSHPYRKWILTFATGLMIFLVNMDVTIVNLALPSLAHVFHADLSHLQWVLTSYLIATCLFFIIGGRFADMFGKKRIFLIGTVLFSMGCLGAALSNTLLMLDIFRFVQGMGFALTLSLAILLNAEAFPKHQQGLSVGISITMTGVAQAIGPTVGGMILQWANWRWMFGYAVPISILSFILTSIFCHKDAPVKRHTRQFFKGLADKQVWHNNTFLITTLIRVLYMFTWASVLLSFPLYFQNILNLSPLQSGLLLLSMTAVIGIMSPITGYITDKIGHRIPMITAVIFTIISFSLLSHISVHTPIWQSALMLFFFGLASGIMIPASVRGAMQSLPESSRGIGMGVFFTLNFFLTMLGITISTWLLNLGNGGNVHHLITLGAFQWVLWMNLALCCLSALFSRTLLKAGKD
jgi:MFS family permease